MLQLFQTAPFCIDLTHLQPANSAVKVRLMSPHTVPAKQVPAMVLNGKSVNYEYSKQQGSTFYIRNSAIKLKLALGCFIESLKKLT